jgi:mannitol-1-/sugar-/sorbitol-6-phosphatase
MTDTLRTADRPATGASLTDRTFAAVLFDMDGTLISSVASVVRSWARLAQELDIAAMDFSRLHGIPARDLVERMLPDRSPAEREHALRRVVAIEMEDTDDIEVLPGAAQALTTLAASGRCAIVTSCGRDLAAVRLRAAGVTVPPVVVTADDVRHGKPDPEPFRLGADRLGVDPRQCLVVEDAAAGIASARAAGTTTLALTTTMTADRLQADHVVGDLAAVRFSLVPDGVRVHTA